MSALSAERLERLHTVGSYPVPDETRLRSRIAGVTYGDLRALLSALAATEQRVREAREQAFAEAAGIIESVRRSYSDEAAADEALEVARNNVLALAHGSRDSAAKEER